MGTSSAMSTSNQYIKYTITVTQNNRNIESNYSNVTVQVRFYRTNTGYTSYGTGTVYCRINGYLYSAKVTPSQKITSSGIILFSKKLVVYHNDNGSKTLDCSAWISHNVVTSSEQSYSQALVAIPRTSSIASIVGTTFGSPTTVTISSASTSFRHTVIYKRPDGAMITVGEGIETICTFTTALSDSNYVPKKASSPVGIIVHTYNGSTLVGTVEKFVTFNVPSGIVPAITNIAITDTSQGITNRFGFFIKGKSKLRVEIVPEGAYSSTIAHQISHMNGEVHNRKVFITGAIKGSGECVTTVTDTRGRTATKTVKYTVYDYFEPYIEKFEVKRCDWYGNEHDEGNCCLCTIKAVVAPAENKNTKDFSLLYKKPNESEYKSTIVSNANYTLETSYIIYDLDMDSPYEIVLQVSDYFVATRLSRMLPTAYTLVDYNASGKGIAFGKVSNKDAFEVGMDTYLNSKLDLGRDSNDEKKIYFVNSAHIQGQTYENDGVYPHSTWIVGGWGSDPNAIKIWDGINSYSPLYYKDATKQLMFGQNGLYSENPAGIYLNQYGNIVKQKSDENGDWNILDGAGNTCFKVSWGNKKIIGGIGELHQRKVLYSNDSGSSSTITTNDDMSKYSVLEVHYISNDGNYGSMKCLHGVGSILMSATPDTTTYFKSSKVYLVNTSISWAAGTDCSIGSSSAGCTKTNRLKIVRVYGYK